MSTLRVNTLQTQAGVEVYTAKAWVNFNGTGTVAIRASGNVSSITDNGTGDYTVNFTSAMTDTNYAVIGTVAQNVPGEGYRWLAVGSGAASNYSVTTTSVRIQAAYSSVDKTDATALNVAVFR